MAQLPPAPAPAASTSFIAYDLRDDSNRDIVLASDALPREAIVSVADLRRAVFASARALFPERYSYLNLDVYPPGSTDWTDRSTAAKPRATIASLLPQADGADDTFVVIARPLPSFGGAHGQSVLALATVHSLLTPLHPQPVLSQLDHALLLCWCRSVTCSLALLLLLLPCCALLCYARRQRAAQPHFPQSPPRRRGPSSGSLIITHPCSVSETRTL